MSQHF